MISSLHTTEVVKNLIIINAIVFVAVFFTPLKSFYGDLAMYYVDAPTFRPWQIVTYMFMHGGIWHLVMNMYGLFLFGTILERIWGAKRFLFYYMATGIGAGLLYLLVEAIRFKLTLGSFFPYTDGLMYYPIPMVGASGAIFGVLAAFALLFPNTELRLLFFPIPIKAKYLIGGYMAYELVRGLQNSPDDHVAHFAHLGGALIGLVIVKYWQKSQNKFY